MQAGWHNPGRLWLCRVLSVFGLESPLGTDGDVIAIGPRRMRDTRVVHSHGGIEHPATPAGTVETAVTFNSSADIVD
jgi:hypothetical protein